MNSKLLISKKEAALSLSVSLRFLEGLIGRKELRARRLGRRVLIERRELERFARRDHLLTAEQSSPRQTSQDPIASALEMPQDAQQCVTEG